MPVTAFVVTMAYRSFQINGHDEVQDDVEDARIRALAKADSTSESYEEIAFRVMKPFTGETFTDAELKGAIQRAYAGFGHAARAPMVAADKAADRP